MSKTYKGYVWGGSQHGRIHTVEDQWRGFTVPHWIGDNLVKTPMDPEPYPKWKRWVCRLIGVPDKPPAPVVTAPSIYEEKYTAQWYAAINRRILIFKSEYCDPPTPQDFRNLLFQYPELVEHPTTGDYQ